MCFPITGLTVDIEGEAAGAAHWRESGDTILGALVAPVHSNALSPTTWHDRQKDWSRNGKFETNLFVDLSKITHCLPLQRQTLARESVSWIRVGNPLAV